MSMLVSTTEPWVLPLGQCQDHEQVGGKAINLARLVQAGFTVPEGFVLTTAAFRQARQGGEAGEAGDAGASMPEDLAEAVRTAYAQMGQPTVAVRSSATAEDGADASMAGQYETVLNVQGEAALLAAIARCWSSLDSPRTRSYLARLGLEPEQVAMGVVVQRQVAADVAGVLFTANPRGSSGGGSGGAMGEMLIEASWGLGESVVSGQVQPDTLVLDAATGVVRQSTIGAKQTQLLPAAGSGGSGGNGDGAQATPAERQAQPCLDAAQVHALWQLGRRIATHFQSPQDIEWAIEGDVLYVVQSRAITTLEAIEAYEQCLGDARRQLRAAAEQGGGPWVVHNLAETLPHPTPLTWDVIRRFMSGDGGFGRLYEQAGFEPAARVRRAGFLDRVAGRLYMDLGRASEMFFEDFPFAYDLDLLRRNPGAAQDPPTVPTGSLRARYQVGRRLAAVARRLDELAEEYDQRFERQLVPAFTAWVQEQKQRDLTTLTAGQWRELWQQREQRVMDDFAPASLLPSLIVTQATRQLRDFLEQQVWDEDPDALARQLASGGEPDTTVQSTQLLYEVGHDPAKLDAWLARFGHRAPEEFDLATPRWRERPEAVTAMAQRLAEGRAPIERHRRQADAAQQHVAELKRHLTPARQAELDQRLAMVHRYQRFREDGKHHLMLGYDLLRDLVLEAQRRLNVGDDLCLLGFDELHDALLTGYAPLHVLAQRRRQRDAEGRLALPPLIEAAHLDALGEPAAVQGADRHTGLAVSDGRCHGPVRLVHKPEDAGELGQGYVLVCPSTDPNWTPLFVGAAGLILERGGALSHGAVVAREMGLPAVVIPDATRRLSEGEPVHVDGRRGVVVTGAAADEPASDATDDEGDAVPRSLIPPVPGPVEARGATLCKSFLLGWAVFFAAYYTLPASWLERPITRGLDELLLPLVAGLGAPAVVACVAVFFAALCMVGQRLLTDTPRLREAARRARQLRREAQKLPADHPRRPRILQLARPVTGRNLQASLVPLAVLLGPMLLTFFWFPERVEPAWRNAPPGTTVYVSATVDGEYLGPVTLETDPALTVAGETAVQHNPPIRPTLEALRRRWSQPSDLAHLQTWEEQAAALQARETLLQDLRRFLDARIPPQQLAWTVQTPADRGGRFPLRLSAGDGQTLTSHIVLGDRFAPEPRTPTDPNRQVIPGSPGTPDASDAPIHELRLSYAVQRERGADVFWAPVEPFTVPPLLSGWLLVYILAYLPAMFLLRWALRVP
ncbi:MAG: PEP/pyruvate-binding domain-containing protein [Phycisphaeraceae bacterium]